MKLNLLVIRSPQPQALASFYELLGMSFEYHQHGNGPMHYAAETEGFVFEIYPLLKKQEGPDVSTRLGFQMKDLDALLAKVKNADFVILKEVHETPWGIQAILKDPDGRKVEVSTIADQRS